MSFNFVGRDKNVRKHYFSTDCWVVHVTVGNKIKCISLDSSWLRLMASLIILFILAQLPRNFGLVPNKALIMIQGQNQSIICQAQEEAFPFDLTWEKQTSAGSYASVNPSMVKRDRSNQMVRAILTIANAKLSDSGIYKCTVSVKHLSNFRLTSVQVKGKLI